MKWYYFEALVHGRRIYIGKCETTEAEIRAAMPQCSITGNLVVVFGRPK